MAVRGVLAEADVCQKQKLRETRAQRAEGSLHDAVLDPGAGALLVLLLEQPEEQDRGDAEAQELLALAHDRLDGVAPEPRQAPVRQRLRRDEERHHQVVDRQRGLADEVAQRAGAAQAAQAGDRKRAPGLTAVLASSWYAAPRAPQG